MITKICKICNLEQDISCFSPYYGENRKDGKRRNVCRVCKNEKQRKSIKNNPERREKLRLYLKEYYKIHKEIGKVKSYRTADKRKGRISITLEEYRNILKVTPFCYYCGETNRYILGLDRKDNSKGHEIENVVTCCEKCNHFLTDIPYEAKILLKEALTKIRELDLFKDWVIKTKRHKL